jgi:hypothetical protein
MSKTMLAMAAAIVGGIGLTSSLGGAAHAAPLAVTTGPSLAGDAVTSVAYGCGPGFIPNRFGFCRPIYRPYGFYGPRRFYGPRHGFYGPRFGYRRHFHGPRPVFGFGF